MVGWKVLAGLFVIAVLLSADASAFSFDDIVKFILGLFGRGGGRDGPSEPVCNPPYLLIGRECCLDRDGNGVCDSDEKGDARQEQAPTTTEPPATQTPAQATTTTAAGASATTTLKSKDDSAVKAARVVLSGRLKEDVDPVLTPDKKTLVLPTYDSRASRLDVVDAAGASLLGSVKLTGSLVAGLDAVILPSGKTVLAPSGASVGPGWLDIIDLTSRTVTRTIRLAGAPEADVDVQVTPGNAYALLPTRLDASNGFLEIVDLKGEPPSARKVNLPGEPKTAVDCILLSSGKTAVMPTHTAVLLVSSVNFVDVQEATLAKALRIDGLLEEDVDGVLTPTGVLLMPTRTPVRGFLTVIDTGSMNVLRKLELSGTLRAGVDPYLLPSGKTAYIPVSKGSQGFVDVIDVAGLQVARSVRLSGDIVKGVDSQHARDGSRIYALSQRGATAYLDAIDPSSGTVLYSTGLSGGLTESVDMLLSDDGKTVYVPVSANGAGGIDAVDAASGRLLKTIEVRAGYRADTDLLMGVNGARIAVPSGRDAGYVEFITDPPEKCLVAMTSGMGSGFADVIDLSTNARTGTLALSGDIVAGVDGISGGQSQSTPDADEDYVGGLDETPPTTTTSSSTTSTSTTQPYPTTTSSQSTTTTSTIRSTTTTSARVVTPRCGDGYLSAPNVPGSGTEECDLADNPVYSDWAGAKAYPCPEGLACVRCRCVGCGDGRLQDGESCDSWRLRSKYGGEYLWRGETISCPYGQKCGSDCKCAKTCGDGVLDSGEQCEEGRSCPQYHACGSDCKCATDCAAFCAAQGAEKLTIGSGGSSADCSQAGRTYMGDPGTCTSKCVKTYFLDGLTGECCCAKVNELPCSDCPCTEGVNCPPKCPTNEQCLAGI